MIQDIQPKHLYNQYKPVPPDRESWALYYEDHKVLVKKNSIRDHVPKVQGAGAAQ